MPETTETTTKRGARKTHKVTDITSKKKGNGKGADDGFDSGPVNKNIRPKQEQLIDTAPIIPEAVKRAAEDYLDIFDQRIALQQQEPVMGRSPGLWRRSSLL